MEQQFQRSILDKKTRRAMLNECVMAGARNIERLEHLRDQLFHKQHMILCVSSQITLVHEELKKLLDTLNKADPSVQEQALTLSAECKELHDEVQMFRSYLESRKLTSLSRVPLQVFNDVHAERRRVLLLSKLLYIKVECCIRGYDILTADEDHQQTIQCIKKRVTPPARLHKEVEYQVLSQSLEELHATVCPTASCLMVEPKMTIQFLESSTPVGDWFKCPHGHYFQGDVNSSSTVETRCPECSTTHLEDMDVEH